MKVDGTPLTPFDSCASRGLFGSVPGVEVLAPAPGTQSGSDLGETEARDPHPLRRGEEGPAHVRGVLEWPSSADEGMGVGCVEHM